MSAYLKGGSAPRAAGSKSFAITTNFEHFAANLNASLDRELKRALQAKVKKAAEIAASDARQHAAVHSEKVAATVRVGSAVQKSGARAIIRAGGPKAPLAQLLELGNLDHSRVRNPKLKAIPGTFRHPVFPKPLTDRKTWTWVEQPTHPFLWPAVERQKMKVAQGIQDAILSTWHMAQPKGGV